MEASISTIILIICIVVVASIVIIGLIVGLLIVAANRIIGSDSKTSNSTTKTIKTTAKSQQTGGTQVGGGQNVSFFTPSNDRAGIIGERQVNRHLRSILDADEYILVNLLLPLKNGGKTELDSVIVSKKGIFCIETKSWVGQIIGDDDDEYWIQKYDDPYRSDRKHKNPVMQNEGHCGTLRRLLNYRFEIENIVIFSELEWNAKIYSNHAYTQRGFREYYQSLSNIFTADVVKQIYQKLVKYVATGEELEKHKQSIQKKNLA